MLASILSLFGNIQLINTSGNIRHTLQCTVHLDTVLDSGEVPTLEATEAVLAGAGVEAADTDLASWWRRDSDLRTLQ